MSDLNLDQKDAFIHLFCPKPRRPRTATETGRPALRRESHIATHTPGEPYGDAYAEEELLSEWDDNDLIESNTIFRR